MTEYAQSNHRKNESAKVLRLFTWGSVRKGQTVRCICSVHGQAGPRGGIENRVHELRYGRYSRY